MENNIFLTQMRNFMADLNINSWYVLLKKNNHFVTATWKLKKKQNKKKEAFFSWLIMGSKKHRRVDTTKMSWGSSKKTMGKDQ